MILTHIIWDDKSHTVCIEKLFRPDDYDGVAKEIFDLFLPNSLCRSWKETIAHILKNQTTRESCWDIPPGIPEDPFINSDLPYPTTEPQPAPPLLPPEQPR